MHKYLNQEIYFLNILVKSCRNSSETRYPVTVKPNHLFENPLPVKLEPVTGFDDLKIWYLVLVS